MAENKSKNRVLVVDDDYDVRQTTRELLELEGYFVVDAENGKEALRKARDFPRPDLIVLDMIMPVMGGREFLDHLLADPAIAQIPVLVISATVDAVNSAGAKGFLKKPIDLDEFLARVEQYTD